MSCFLGRCWKCVNARFQDRSSVAAAVLPDRRLLDTSPGGRETFHEQACLEASRLEKAQLRRRFDCDWTARARPSQGSNAAYGVEVCCVYMAWSVCCGHR